MRIRALALDALWFATGVSLGVMAVTLYIEKPSVQFYLGGPTVAEIIAR